MIRKFISILASFVFVFFIFSPTNVFAVGDFNITATQLSPTSVRLFIENLEPWDSSWLISRVSSPSVASWNGWVPATTGNFTVSGLTAGTNYTFTANLANSSQQVFLTRSVTLAYYTVTGVVGGTGGGSISPASQSVMSGGTTTFTATADPNYEFSSFSGNRNGCVGGTTNGGGTGSPTYNTLTITGSCTVTANFTAIPPDAKFAMSVNSTTAFSTRIFLEEVEPWGSDWILDRYSSPAVAGWAPGYIPAVPGNVTVSGLTPNTQYTFYGYMSFAPPPQFFLTRSVTFTTPMAYTATAVAGSGGSISPSSRVVSAGTSTSFTVTPNSGYSIASVSGCSGTPSTSSPYSTGAINGNCTVNATFAISSAPDLTASNTTPTTAIVGQLTTLSSTVSNIGNSSTGASFSNFYQVASQAAGAGTLTPLAATSMATLVAGASNTATQSHTFASPGTYSIRVCADKSSVADPGVITEANESNNCSPWVDVRVGPDLTAGNTTPTSASTGVATVFSSTISNIGNQTTGATFINFFQYSTLANGGGTVTDIPHDPAMATLTSGSSSVATKSYAFPSAGTFYMRACADKSSSASTGSITEANETNNCSPAWTAVTVGNSTPNLTVGSPTPTSAVAGVPTNLSAVVYNIGNASTGINFDNLFQVNTGSGGGGTLVTPEIQWVNVPSGLAFGSDTTISTTYTFPSVATYSIRACADKWNAADTGRITESNEGDNCSNWVNVDVVNAIDGACSTIHYGCGVGTSINNVSGVSSWTWTCQSPNGGADATCSQTKKKPKIQEN